MTANVLFQAQNEAKNALETAFFPCYSKTFIESQEGFKGKVIWVYSKIYDGADFLYSNIVTVISKISELSSKIFSPMTKLFKPAVDFVYPINPINNQRHLICIVPRSVEKIFGKVVSIFITSGLSESNELLDSSDHKTIASKVENVFQALIKANKKLLNPKNMSEFDYEIKTVISNQKNAFALPGGKIVVFDQIVKDIYGCIQSKKIKNSIIKFADGSEITIDLSNVTLDDALAALIGHEMTHVASRHSMVRLVTNYLLSCILNIGRCLLVFLLKIKDKEYVALKNNKSVANQQKLLEKEKFYIALNNFFIGIESKIQGLLGLLKSRTNEYEADVTGAYFAHNTGYNPLGAIYLHEVLKKEGFLDFIHRNFEPIFTHPYSENRKRAIFAAINVMAKNTIQVQKKEFVYKYDLKRSSSGVTYSQKFN